MKVEIFDYFIYRRITSTWKSIWHISALNKYFLNIVFGRDLLCVISQGSPEKKNQ